MLFFFDVETTGLPKRRNASYSEVDVWPRIVSISWALHKPDQSLVAHKYSVIRPDGFSIPADSTRVHGITTAYAKQHGRAVADVLRELNSDLEHHRPSLVIAHNIAFDRNVLLAEALRAKCSTPIADVPTYCTMQTTTDLCRLPGYGGRYKWPTLAELHHHLFSEGFGEAHNAAADVLACARCYFALPRASSSDRRVPANALNDDIDDNVDPHELIGRILLWAEDHPSFDTSFVESIQEKFAQFGRLTPRQIAALENIVIRWQID